MQKQPDTYFFMDIQFGEQHFRLCNVPGTDIVQMHGEDWQAMGGMINVEPRQENISHVDIEIGPVQNSHLSVVQGFVREHLEKNPALEPLITLRVVNMMNGKILTDANIIGEQPVNTQVLFGLNNPFGRILIKNYDAALYDAGQAMDFNDGLGG